MLRPAWQGPLSCVKPRSVNLSSHHGVSLHNLGNGQRQCFSFWVTFALIEGHARSFTGSQQEGCSIASSPHAMQNRNNPNSEDFHPPNRQRSGLSIIRDVMNFLLDILLSFL
jgi:hypothetical protein